jgi:predicted kinase
VFVSINGVEQGLIISSRDRNRAVLLYLHGGMPDYFLARRHHARLDDTHRDQSGVEGGTASLAYTRTMLIVFGGLPGVGKTSLARALCKATSAFHVRIDSIEDAIRASGVTVVSLDDAGYRVAYAVAADNLRLGRVVVADSVNPLPVTRTAWTDVARRCGVLAVEAEIRCSDVAEHRRRVDARRVRLGGPTWSAVCERDYRPWPSATCVVDTATLTVEQALAQLRSALDVWRRYSWTYTSRPVVS